jgi:hypothetical protein
LILYIALPQYLKAIEKTRMTEGIAIAKAVGQAQQRYYLLTGQYTNDINDLDISLSGTMRHFNIHIGPSNEVVRANRGVLLERLPLRYTIVYCMKNDSIWCGASSSGYGKRGPESVALCASLGGIKGNPADLGCATERSENYKL